MSRFKDIHDQEFYKRKNIPVGPKPEIHFYPDITDDAIKSGVIDIDFTISYIDTLNKINNLEDDIHTPQMAFANPKTAETHDCYMHKLNLINGTQTIARIEFSHTGEVIVKEWI